MGAPIWGKAVMGDGWCGWAHWKQVFLSLPLVSFKYEGQEWSSAEIGFGIDGRTVLFPFCFPVLCLTRSTIFWKHCSSVRNLAR